MKRPGGSQQVCKLLSSPDCRENSSPQPKEAVMLVENQMCLVEIICLSFLLVILL